MSSISIFKENGEFDIDFENGKLKTDKIESKAILSLLTNARNESFGFWMDSITGNESGSDIYLQDGRLTQDNINFIIESAEKALEFVVEEGFMKEINIDNSINSNNLTLIIEFIDFNENKKTMEFVI